MKINESSLPKSLKANLFAMYKAVKTAAAMDYITPESEYSNLSKCIDG
jgi:hypothetical protein